MKKALVAFLLVLCVIFSVTPAVFADDAANAAYPVVLPDGVTVETFGDNTVTDGTNYYANITTAVNAVYGVDAVLYCKPGADVGQMTHGAVKANLTVYGNGAYTGGNGDFDIGNCNYYGAEITSDITLTVYSLDGCGAWGYKATAHTVNIIFANCKDMSEVYLSNYGSTHGTTNITMTDCEFTDNVDGGNCKVYTNANGTVTLTRVLFSGVDKAVNLNHKDRGKQTVVLTDCTFTDCGNDVANDEIPVRVLSSVEGGESQLTVSGCTFTGTVEGGADILLDYGAGTTEAAISGTAANVVVEKENNVGTTTVLTAEESKSFSNVEKIAVAKIGDTEFATLAEAVEAVEDGGTITLIENEIFTQDNRAYNSGSWYDGLYYIGDKSFTIDLNDFTISQDGAVNDYLLNFKNDGAKANTITIKNGTLDAGTTAFCAICTATTSTQQITIDLEDINVINSVSNGSTIKLRGGAILNVKSGTVITGKDSYLGIECVASTVNIYDGAEIYMNGINSYNGCLVGACAGGTVNVYGGYGKGVKGGFIAMTSGGTVNVYGGEWIANTNGTIGENSNYYVLTAQNNKDESGYIGASIINVYGGTFRGGMDAWILTDINDEKAELNIEGGNFNADPTAYLNEGFVANANNGVYTVAKAVAKIGDNYFASIEDALGAAAKGDVIELLADTALTEVIVLNDVELTVTGDYKLNVNDADDNSLLKIGGESTLNIECTLAGEIWLEDGAIIKDSAINGEVFVAGDVTFRGANTVNMLYDFGTLTSNYGTAAPMKWTVEKGASLKILNKARYGLGYGDCVTVYGSVVDALTARETLTEGDVAFFTHGIVAQESVTWNCNSSLTVKDAYVVIGSNNSFGNKSGNYGGNYTIYFENSVLDASRITFYDTASKTTFTFNKTDAKMGQFMTKDADSVFIFIDSKILSTATSNGSDESNTNAGTMELTASSITYNALFTNNGTISLDLASSISAPAIAGNGKFVIDVTGWTEAVKVVSGDFSAFTGTVELANDTTGKLTYAILEDGVYVIRTLKGAGTEENPYLIEDVDDLIIFRDDVNTDNTKYGAEGVYVALANDIDMKDVDWSVNIGDAADYSFCGIFDGKGFKILNLNSTETAIDPYGYICTGLFGCVEGNAVIKNLIIENVNINAEFTGNNVGILVGFSYKGAPVIDGVTVCGDIVVNAPNAYGVGLVGYEYYGKLTVKNCVINAEAGSKLTGTGVGAIIGYTSGSGSVEGCTVKGIAIEGKGLLGGIVGIAADSAFAVNGCTVENVAITVNGEMWQNSAAIAIGTIASNGITVSDTVYDNVTVNGTATEAIVGSAYAEKPTTPVAAVEARIGDKYYTTFSAALAAAKDGETVTLVKDVELDNSKADGNGYYYVPITIEKSISIDGNGHKITPADAEKTFHSVMEIGNSGWGDETIAAHTVTIKNLEVSGFTAVYSVLRVQGVKLSVENCYFKNNEVLYNGHGVISFNFADGSVSGSRFEENVASSVVVFNYNVTGGSSNTSFSLVDNEFIGNECNGTAVAYYVSGESAIIDGNVFERNTVTSQAAAVIYLSDVATVSNNEIFGNVITGTGAAGDKCGVIATGSSASGSVISGNAFASNTVATTGSNITVTVWVGSNDVDVSSNYWGGANPNDDGQIHLSKSGLILDDYYTTYTDGVLGGLTKIVEKPEFSGASLLLQNNIAIRFTVSKAALEEAGFTSPYVVFEFNGVETVVTDYTENSDGTKYVFTFANIAPNRMGETVSATLYVDCDGVEYASEVKEYSVKEYCYDVLASYEGAKQAELRTLIVDLLNYGAAAQLYTDHNVDALVNADLTAEQAAYGTVGNRTLVDSLNVAYATVEQPVASFAGAALVLGDSVTLKLKLVAESIDGLSVKITTEISSYEIMAEDFVAGSGCYYVYFDELTASQFSDVLYITVMNGENAVSNTATYSVESYAYATQNGENELAALVKAMMNYGDAAKAFAE